MSLFTKRLGLVLAGVVGVGAVASLALGASLAMFTSAAPSSITKYDAGTVTLTACPGTAAPGFTCKGTQLTKEFGPIVPGDSEPSTNYTVTLGQTAPGSVPAFVAVDVSITSTAAQPCSAASLSGCTGTGTWPLINNQPSSDGTGLTIYGYSPSTGGTKGATEQVFLNPQLIASSAMSCVNPTGTYVCTLTINNMEWAGQPYTAGAQYANEQWLGENNHSGPTTNNIQVAYNLPVSTPPASCPGTGLPGYTCDPNNYVQGSKAEITLTAHAVQFNNQGVPSGGNPTATVGLSSGQIGTVCASTYQDSLTQAGPGDTGTPFTDASGNYWCPTTWN